MPEKEKKKQDEEIRPEWIFKVFKNPAGLAVDHSGEITTLSHYELRDLVFGDTNLGKYPMIPKRLHRTFLVKACDALDLIYRPQMLEAVKAPVIEKVKLEFDPKMPWDIALERAKELKVTIELWNKDIEKLEKFAELIDAYRNSKREMK